MTVTNSTAKTSALPGDGSTFSFSFSPLVIYAEDELIVIKTTVATGVEETITKGTGSNNYSVTVASYPGTGTITYPADSGTAMTSDYTLTIKKDLDYEQQLDLGNQNDYDPAAVEEQFDKLVGLQIQMKEELDRCIKVPMTYTSITETGQIDEFLTTDTGKYLRLDSTGTRWSLAAVSSSSASASDATPQAVADAGAAGSSADFSRADHVHPHPAEAMLTDEAVDHNETFTALKGADVASAAALAVDIAGNIFDVTGTTTITSMNTKGVGTVIHLQFDGSLTLTHHATDLILPDGHDIVTKAGDTATFIEYASGDWYCLSYNENTAIYKRKAVDFTEKVTFWDDFVGTISTPISSTAGSGTGNAAATISAGAGGRITLTSASDDGTHAANGTSLSCDTLDWRADQGGLTLETRLKISDVSETAIFVGFSDTISTTVELPVYKTSGADTLDSDATDACGIGYDVDGTTDQWWHGGTKAGTDTAATHSGAGPSDNTWVVLRVEVTSAGAVRGWVDGTAIGSATANAITTTTPLTPYIVIANRSANQVVATIDYLWVQMNRPTTA